VLSSSLLFWEFFPTGLKLLRTLLDLSFPLDVVVYDSMEAFILFNWIKNPQALRAFVCAFPSFRGFPFEVSRMPVLFDFLSSAPGRGRGSNSVFPHPLYCNTRTTPLFVLGNTHFPSPPYPVACTKFRLVSQHWAPPPFSRLSSPPPRMFHHIRRSPNLLTSCEYNPALSVKDLPSSILQAPFPHWPPAIAFFFILFLLKLPCFHNDSSSLDGMSCLFPSDRTRNRE